jgi:TRAP-type C4-dicarboxylate transport system substrate-binding protein
MNKKHLSVASIAISMMFAAQASAQSIAIKVADSLPPSHPIIVEGLQVWMKRVNELSGNKVTFEHFPAQQLGKAGEMLRIAQSGVADITYVGPGYVSDKLPLSDVASLPGLFTESCVGTKAFQTLATNGILDTQEFRPNGVKVLMTATLPAYQIFATTKPLNSLADIKGMKIRSGGGSNDLTLQALGAVPVKVPAPEIMEVMQRGTVDANMGPYTSQTTYGFAAHEKYATYGAPLGSFVTTYVIQLKRWNALPADVRAAMEKAGLEANARLCAFLQNDEIRSAEVMEKSGIKLWRLNADALAQLRKVSSDVQTKWAKDLDARGKPGSDMLKAFNAALASSK